MWSFILTILFSQTNARKEVILWKVYKLRTNRQTVAEYRVSEKVNEWAIQFNFTIMISSCLSPHWRTASVKHIRKYMYICVHLNLLAPYCQKNTMFSPRKRTVNPAVGAALALSQHAHDTLEKRPLHQKKKKKDNYMTIFMSNVTVKLLRPRHSAALTVMQSSKWGYIKEYLEILFSRSTIIRICDIIMNSY